MSSDIEEDDTIVQDPLGSKRALSCTEDTYGYTSGIIKKYIFTLLIVILRQFPRGAISKLSESLVFQVETPLAYPRYLIQK